MRAISKILTGSMIAAAALAVSACGSKTETTTDNTMVTDLGNGEDMGTMTDNMTAVDGAMTGNMDSGMGMGNGGMATDNTMMTDNSMMMNSSNAM
jgi:hypothetical protein